MGVDWCGIGAGGYAGDVVFRCSVGGGLPEEFALARKRMREFKVVETNMAGRKARLRGVAGLSTLDDMLAGEGELEEFEAVAIKEDLAWQIEAAMKE